MPVYVFIEIKVLDAGLYAGYVDKVAAIVEKFGGRYLVRGGQITPLGGDWHPERVILLEFPSEEQVKTWLTSPEYAEVAPLREKSTVSKAIVLEGCAGPV